MTASIFGPVVQGIDISKWQQRIDWPRVVSSGVRFVCVKATEGQSVVDGLFTTHRENVRKHGLVFGAYHFCRPDGDPQDAELEARHFFKVVGTLEAGDMPPAVDIEASALKGQALVDWTNAFSAECEKLFERRIVVYTYPFFFAGQHATPNGLIAERDLWVAHYGQYDRGLAPIVPKPWTRWRLWQTHGDDGRVDGVTGPCDRNVFAGDEAAFADWIDSRRIGVSRVLDLPPDPRGTLEDARAVVAELLPPSNDTAPITARCAEWNDVS